MVNRYMTRSETTSSAGQPSFNARIFVSSGSAYMLIIPKVPISNHGIRTLFSLVVDRIPKGQPIMKEGVNLQFWFWNFKHPSLLSGCSVRWENRISCLLERRRKKCGFQTAIDYAPNLEEAVHYCGKTTLLC